MWRGIKLLSSWHCDQVRAARFQSSAAFRTGRTVASHCGTAERIQCISAEPGGPGKKWGARTAIWPEQHSLVQPLHSHPGNHTWPQPWGKMHYQTPSSVVVSQEFKSTSHFRHSSLEKPAPSSPIYLYEPRSVAIMLFSSLFIFWSTWPFGKENAIDWLLQSYQGSAVLIIYSHIKMRLSTGCSFAKTLSLLLCMFFNMLFTAIYVLESFTTNASLLVSI